MEPGRKKKNRWHSTSPRICLSIRLQQRQRGRSTSKRRPQLRLKSKKTSKFLLLRRSLIFPNRAEVEVILVSRELMSYLAYVISSRSVGDVEKRRQNKQRKKKNELKMRRKQEEQRGKKPETDETAETQQGSACDGRASGNSGCSCDVRRNHNNQQHQQYQRRQRRTIGTSLDI